MFFLHPMWVDESQRIGKQRCTPVGYALHIVAELIGFCGALLFLMAPIMMAMHWLRGTFQPWMWWLWAASLTLGVISEVLYQFSWWLADRQGFEYSHEQRESSWIVGGERKSFRYDPELKD